MQRLGLESPVPLEVVRADVALAASEVEHPHARRVGLDRDALAWRVEAVELVAEHQQEVPGEGVELAAVGVIGLHISRERNLEAALSKALR